MKRCLFFVSLLRRVWSDVSLGGGVLGGVCRADDWGLNIFWVSCGRLHVVGVCGGFVLVLGRPIRA